MAPQGQQQRPNLHLDLTDLANPHYPLQPVHQELPEYQPDDRPRDELGQTYYDAAAEISSLEVESPEIESPNRGSHYVESNHRHVSWTAELVETVGSPQVAQSQPKSPSRIITRLMAPFRRGSETAPPQSVVASPVQPERRYFTLKKRVRAKT